MRNMKRVTKITDVKNDWCWYNKNPLLVKAVELVENIEVKTLEGIEYGHIGDYLIQGIEGELYVCRRGIFFKSYVKHNLFPVDDERVMR